MTIYDITYPLYQGIPVWQGDPQLQITAVTSLDAGEAVNTLRLTLGSHTGTHVDAPAHLIRSGATVDILSLEALIGQVIVVDCTGQQAITEQMLAPLLEPGIVRILLKTDDLLGASGEITTSAFLTPAAAESLVAHKLVLVGTSSPSVDPFDSVDLPSHRVLLQAGLMIIENLALQGVPAGRYILYCLPLALVGGDGAPARVLLESY